MCDSFQLLELSGKRIDRTGKKGKELTRPAHKVTLLWTRRPLRVGS